MSIYLIRHAESEFNAGYAKLMRDPMIFDSPLSKLGRSQAIETRAIVADLDISRIVVSPFTRTLETAELIFQRSLPMLVNSVVREQTSHSCDVGSHPDQLSRDWAHLDFSHLEPHWWHKGEEDDHGIPVEPLSVVEARAEAFVEFARQSNMKSTAVVSHGNFIRVLTGIQPENCQVIKLDI